MGYICQVDLEHHEGAPVKVVTHKRQVNYIHNNGMSVGFETAREVDVHPSNVDVLGEPVTVPAVKTVDDTHKVAKKRWERKPPAEETPSYIDTWNEYKQAKGVTE